MSENSTFEAIGEILQKYQTFAVISHVRPDGDAIGSMLALGCSLLAMGKTVHFWNEDGLPDSLAFLAGSERVVLPPVEPQDIDVVLAVDTATKPRLGDNALHAASKAKVWVNIDHHISNPRYGDLNYIDASSPATGQILYDLIRALDMPLPAESRDAIYVAVSTDTGSFQYPATTAKTYELAAQLIRCGLDVGPLNIATYHNYPYRRVELMRSLLNTLERSEDGRVAHWELSDATREKFQLQPEDSEGLIDIIRAIQGVLVAIFFEELPDGKVRVSMRSKDSRINVCEICALFGGGGHALAAGIRMRGPIEEAREQVIAAVENAIQAAGITAID